MALRPLLQEARLALRALVRRPSFTLPMLGTLTLGLAAVAVVLAVLRATLFAPLPFAEGDRLVTLDIESTKGYSISISMPNYEDWRAKSRVFDRFAAGAPWSFLLSGRGSTEVVSAALVLGDWFDTLSLRPQVGAFFGADRTARGAAPIAVLSDAAWRKRFAGDPAIVGQAILLDGKPYTVVGVLPKSGVYPTPDVEVFVPMGALGEELPWDDRDSSFGARPIARRKPGVSLAAADADMQRVWREIEASLGKRAARPHVLDLRAYELGDGATSGRLAGLAVLVLFGLAVANALHLALARAEERRGELAVRRALGASRLRLGRLLAWEACLLTSLATVLALGLALVAVHLSAPWLAGAAVAAFDRTVEVDAGVGLWTLAFGLAAAAVLSLAPGRVLLDPAQARRARRPAARRPRRARAGLLVTEVAGAVLLVALASLLARSETLVGRVDKGFDPTGVFAARVVAPDRHYADSAAWQRASAEILSAVRRLPGVEHAAFTLTLPLSRRSWEMSILPGDVPFDPEKADSVLFNLVSDDSFATLGIPVVQGRAFDAHDRDGEPLVAIVDETLAAKYWPGKDPLGQRVMLEAPQRGPDGKRLPEIRTVVGVTRNVRHYALEKASRIQVYVPVAQSNGRYDINLELAVRRAHAAPGFASELRRVVAGVDPALALSRAGELARFVEAALGPRRQLARLFAAFGFLALALAAAGVFAVMTHAVAARRSELGIRSALGADARRLLLQVLGGALASGALGVVCGGLGGALSSRALGAMLFGVGGFDPRAQLTSAAVVLGAVALAALVPALRAARVEPARLLTAGERLTR